MFVCCKLALWTSCVLPKNVCKRELKAGVAAVPDTDEEATAMQAIKAVMYFHFCCLLQKLTGVQQVLRNVSENWTCPATLSQNEKAHSTCQKTWQIKSSISFCLIHHLQRILQANTQVLNNKVKNKSKVFWCVQHFSYQILIKPLTI